MRPESSRILSRGRAAPALEITEDHLLALPEPVRRYLHAAGVVGRPAIRTVCLRQKGFFRRGDRWLPFTASQYFATDPPEFVWEARVALLPLVNFTVADMFVEGHGALQAKLFSLFPVMKAGGPETDHGELLRYLAEMAWFPTAWLSPRIAWEAIDGHAARATLRLGDIEASAVIRFDHEFRICEVAARRPMLEGKTSVLRDWSGRYSDYRRNAGLLVPFRAAVTWHLDQGPLEYFRGELTELAYDR